MKTTVPIKYHMYSKSITIPVGTEVKRATNLPDPDSNNYWAKPWPGMTDKEDALDTAQFEFNRRSKS